jgi:hypothetical protein
MATLHTQMDFYSGDSMLIDVTINDAEGNALDLTGCDLEWMLNDPDGLNVLTYSIRDGTTTGNITIVNNATGQIQITVPASEAAGFTPGYWHDQLRVWVTDPGFEDVLATQMIGTVKIRPALSPGEASLATSAVEVSSPVLDPGEIAGGMGG